MTRVGLVRAVNPIAVELTRPDIGEVTVKDLVCIFRQFDPRRLVARQMVEKTHLDFRRIS